MTVTEQTEAIASVETVAPPAPEVPSAGALLPANLVAEREQARLLRRDGRTGAAAAASGLVHTVRWLSGADAASRGLRYLPAVWTVVAVAAVALYLPGDPPTPDVPADLAVAVPVSPVTAPGDEAPVSPAPSAPTGGVAVPTRPAPRPGGTSGSFTPSAPVAPSGASAPVASESGPPAFEPPADPDDAAQLELREHAWAGTLGDIGVAATPVPEGTLPVAARLGQPEKVSYLRLTGEGSLLLLVEDPGGADESFGEGAVRLCAVEDGDWEAGPGQRLAQMPGWTDECADGERVGDRWTFDLDGLGEPGAQSGWALVPGDDVTPSFQLTFRADRS